MRPIADAAAAWRIVDRYRQRWAIARLFRVVKSQGLPEEDIPMASAKGLAKLAATSARAACFDSQLMQQRDGEHRMPPVNLFTEAGIVTAGALIPELKGGTKRHTNPHPVGSLAQGR
jgi:hypothetical protein